MVRCRKCGHVNPGSAWCCSSCGEPIAPSARPRPQATRQLDEQDRGEPWRQNPTRFDETKRLILRVIGSGKLIPVDVHKTEGVVLGRRDLDIVPLPDVDMAPYDGYKLGVSRRHATIRLGNYGFLNVCDLGSSNGTFVNGERLNSNQPYILRDGDELRLGHLALQALFVVASDWVEAAAT